MKRLVWVAPSLVLSLALGAVAQKSEKDKGNAKHKEPIRSDAVQKAVAVVHALGDSNVSGRVVFTQRDGHVEVHAEISGLEPGRHGFHVHEFGDCSAPDGKSAGDHFNPTSAPHAGPDAKKRHAGDLGNLDADDNGEATLHAKDPVIQLRGPHSIVGRAVIIHVKEDDLKSQPAGDSGDRIAYGVIGIAKP